MTTDASKFKDMMEALAKQKTGSKMQATLSAYASLNNFIKLCQEAGITEIQINDHDSDKKYALKEKVSRYEEQLAKLKNKTETEKFDNFADDCGDDEKVDRYFAAIEERENLKGLIEGTISTLKDLMNQTTYPEKEVDATLKSFTFAMCAR